MPGTATQCATGIMVCFVSITVLASCRPCIQATNTLILGGTQVAQFLTLFGK